MPGGPAGLRLQLRSEGREDQAVGEHGDCEGPTAAQPAPDKPQASTHRLVPS